MASAQILPLARPRPPLVTGVLPVDLVICGGAPSPKESMSATAPSPDPRVGLRAGLMDAERGLWNLRVVSKTPPSEKFLGVTNSDLAFIGNYAIQGSYNGYQVWDIADPRQAVASRRRMSAPPRRATSRSTRTCSSSRVKDLAGRHRLRHAGGAGHGQHRPAPRHPDLRHHRHHQSEERGQRADLPRLPHPHACWWIPRTRRMSTSTSRARRQSARPASSPAA